MKTHLVTPSSVFKSHTRHGWNPIRDLSPQSLARQLDQFHLGYLRPAALTFNAIQRRDPLLASVILKRKLAAASNGFEIEPLNGSNEANEHVEALHTLISNLLVTNAIDDNERGGIDLLLRQMMDAVGMKYAVHEIIWRPGDPNTPSLSAELRFVPLWFFENRSGRLRFLPNDSTREGLPLDPGGWLLTTGPGLMEPSAIAYLYKSLPLRDWLLYCERNGMPGVKGTTEAPVNSPEWNVARDAVESFGAEFHALFAPGTDIEAIDLSSRSTLPYPELIERMDRAMTILWRGADLSTLSRRGGVGASVQETEASLLAEGDARMLTNALHTHLTVPAIEYTFGTKPLARIRILPAGKRDPQREIAILRAARELDLPVPAATALRRLDLPVPRNS